MKPIQVNITEKDVLATVKTYEATNIKTKKELMAFEKKMSQMLDGYKKLAVEYS